jgi:uncharacterized membrane protein (UPF0127 family)
MNSKAQILADLEVADGTWKRMRGLLGRRALAEDQGLFIPNCSSIHTFFMNFPIDVVFVDRHMVVRKTLKGVKPGRLIWPVWRARSVIELGEGFLQRHPLQVGEKLNVDRSLS